MRTSPLSRALIRTVIVCNLLVGRVAAQPQSSPSNDPLAPVARLLGRWAGTAEGQPGKGEVERQYERVLGSRFIQVRNRSRYPPQEKNPKGETHEDIGFLSFDSARKGRVSAVSCRGFRQSVFA
jgi:hypothetical protein